MHYICAGVNVNNSRKTRGTMKKKLCTKATILSSRSNEKQSMEKYCSKRNQNEVRPKKGVKKWHVVIIVSYLIPLSAGITHTTPGRIIKAMRGTCLPNREPLEHISPQEHVASMLPSNRAIESPHVRFEGSIVAMQGHWRTFFV